MKSINRFKIISIFMAAAYLLSACGGALPQSTAPAGGPKVQANEVAFMGTVEAINGDQWTISGQQVKVDPQTSLDPNIKVGDIVRVEGSVGQDGVVVALKVESSISDDAAGNSNTGNENGVPDNTNTDNGNANDNTSVDNSNSANDNSNNGNGAGDSNEVFGVVEAVTTDSITVDGVTYSFASFTEFKDTIAVGDQVKIHVIVNADGTFTIREIEKSTGADDNSNGNANDDDSNGNGDDDNSNGGGGNSNGDDDNSGGGGGNSNDDDKDDDNSNGNG